MRDGARLAAAIAVLGEIETRHVPARLALKRWGADARYAGAKDRAFVAGAVLDALRRRRSVAWRMADESPRGAILGVARFGWSWPADRLEAAVHAAEHGPGPLTAAEREALASPRDLADAPAAVRGDYPDWAEPLMTRRFGETRAAQGEALARRAPLDLRVNTLKTDRDRAQKMLAPLGAEPIGPLDTSLRIAAPGAAERASAVESSPAFARGWFEVQDLGSQIAAACAGPLARAQTLDFCAGGGGKTLALAAAMANTGQIFAHDADPRRLAETLRRARRAGVRNLQLVDSRDPQALAQLAGRMDLVFVDAPCSGSGTWRRRPDAKWRLSRAQLDRRIGEQDAILDAAAPKVKPGGRLIYVTCSIFAEENEDRAETFLERHREFAAAPLAGPAAALGAADGPLRLTPLGHGTDGFFVTALVRRP